MVVGELWVVAVGEVRGFEVDYRSLHYRQQIGSLGEIVRYCALEHLPQDCPRLLSIPHPKDHQLSDKRNLDPWVYLEKMVSAQMVFLVELGDVVGPVGVPVVGVWVVVAVKLGV